MISKVLKKFVSAVLFSFGVANVAQAMVVNSSDVNGFHTFQDTSTGLIWLDLNSFSNMNGNDMIAAAKSAGFTIGSGNKVWQLLSGLPLSTGAWSTYADIMGASAFRSVIWGMYDDSSSNTALNGYSYAYSSDVSWQIRSDVTDPTKVQLGQGFADMGLFAYLTTSVHTVPEPSSFALFGLGLTGLAFARKRKNA